MNERWHSNGRIRWAALMLTVAMGGCAVVPVSHPYGAGGGAAVVVSPPAVLVTPFLHWSHGRHWHDGHRPRHFGHGRGRGGRGWGRGRRGGHH